MALVVIDGDDMIVRVVCCAIKEHNRRFAKCTGRECLAYARTVRNAAVWLP